MKESRERQPAVYEPQPAAVKEKKKERDENDQGEIKG